MIFIDWISTPDHKNFNRAFFYTLGSELDKCYVFSEGIVVPEIECICLPSTGARFRRTIEVLKLVWRYRKNQICFISYDPVFLPLVSLIKRKILVFEHNTTPDKKFSKHFFWQLFLFRWVHRMAQFPAQYERLKSLGGNVTYIGSPLMPINIKLNIDIERHQPYLFLAPSYRANLSLLNKYETLFKGSTIIVKNFDALCPNSLSKKFDIKRLDRVDFIYQGRTVDATIITIQSRIRGTGWFNDCISNFIPILIIDLETKLLFQETFPNYPFIFLDDVKSTSELSIFLDSMRQFDSIGYVSSHNERFRSRYIEMHSLLEKRSKGWMEIN